MAFPTAVNAQVTDAVEPDAGEPEAAGERTDGDGDAEPEELGSAS